MQMTLKNHIFFQTPLTDATFSFAHARLRNSNTCAIQRPFCDCTYNMGMFIDILPLDGISKDDRGVRVFNEISRLLVDSSTSMKIRTKYLNKRDKERVQSLIPVNPIFRFERIQQLAQTYDSEKEDYVYQSMAVVYGFERSVLRKEDFFDCKYVDFEGFSLPVPIGYDRILRTIYGNYLDFPPVEKRGIWHGELWLDTDKSYKEVKYDEDYIKWSESDY